MQGIYTHIPEANYFPREYSVAAILLLLFMVIISLVSVLNLLYFYVSTFRSMCAVPNMAVFCSYIIIIIIIKFQEYVAHYAHLQSGVFSTTYPYTTRYAATTPY